MTLRLLVNLLKTDRDPRSPDATDPTTTLRQDEHDGMPVVILGDAHDRVHHLLDLRVGDRPEPMTIEMNITGHVAYLLATTLIILASLALAGKRRTR